MIIICYAIMCRSCVVCIYNNHWECTCRYATRNGSYRTPNLHTWCHSTSVRASKLALVHTRSRVMFILVRIHALLQQIEFYPSK